MSKRTESHNRLVYKKRALDNSFSNLNMPRPKEESTGLHSTIKKAYFSRSLAKLSLNTKNRSESTHKHYHRTAKDSSNVKPVRIHRPTRSMHEEILNSLPKTHAKSSGIQTKFLASQSAFKALIESDTANASILGHIKACYEEYINMILEKPSVDSKSVQCSDFNAELSSRQSDDTQDTYKREIPKIDLKPASSIDGFHDEFMQNYDDFSESWRKQIDQHKKN